MHSRLIGQPSTLHYAIWHVRCFDNARNGQEGFRGNVNEDHKRGCGRLFDATTGTMSLMVCAFDR